MKIAAVLIAAIALYTSHAQAAMIYQNDFEGTVGSEWSNTSTSVTPIGGRLGRES